MKLYTYDPAPSPQRLTHFMRYKGIEIDTQQIDMMGGEHLSEEYRAIVPERTVPALVLDDGTVLAEVIGICTYLEALYPEKPLLGATALEKGLVSCWDHKVLTMLFMAVAEALRNSSPGFKGRALPGPLDLEQIPALAERGKLRLQWGWEQFDRFLGDGRQFLAGDNISLADIDLSVCAGFSGWVKCSPPEELGNLHGYLDRVSTELGKA